MKKIILFLSIIPLLTFSQTQIGQDFIGQDFDVLGQSIDVSSDGKIIVIGVPGFSDGSGQARIYSNDNNTWTQIGTLDGDVDDSFGNEVALSSDGTTIAVNASGPDIRYVDVYENQNNTWVQVGQRLNGIVDGDRFGHSLSLSADGSILSVGIPRSTVNGGLSGQLRVYENLNGVWTQIGQPINGDASGDFLSLRGNELSSDGSVLAVSAHTSTSNALRAGKVKLFKNQNGSWAQIGSDILGDAENDRLGSSVSLSSDGSIVAIGAPESDLGAANGGLVRVFRNVADEWEQIGQDITGLVEDLSGFNLSLSGDGITLAIASPFNSETFESAGKVRIFKNQSDSWVQVGNEINGTIEFGTAGIEISLSTDGSTLMVGSPNYDDFNLRGKAQVFGLDPLLSVDESSKSQFKIYPNPVSNILNIELQNGSNLERVNLYNTLGQLIVSKKEAYTMNVSNLSNGIYTLEVITNNGKMFRKVLLDK